MSSRIPHLNPELDRRLRVTGRYGFRGFLRTTGCFALAVFVLSAADAQRVSQTGSASQQHINPMDAPPVFDPAMNMQARRIRVLNVERQKALVSDTENLLKLTMQLNAEVAKDRSSTLNPEQVRMLAKIEKLAKSVREKMSDPVQRNLLEDTFPPSMGPPLPVR